MRRFHTQSRIPSPPVILLLQHAWTILLAIVALLEFAACFSTWLEGWTEGRKQTHAHSIFSKPRHSEINGSDFCPATWTIEEDNETWFTSSGSNPTSTQSCGTLFLVFGRPKGRWKLFLVRCMLVLQHHHSNISLLFNLLCIVESIRRSLGARQTALDTAALDDFEATLASLYSATRLSVFRQNNAYGSSQKQDDLALIRKFVRVWTPVVSTLVGWFVLLPWPFLFNALVPRTPWDFLAGTMHIAGGNTNSTYFMVSPSCGADPSLATFWISQASHRLVETLLISKEVVLAWLWKVALPLNLLWMQPWQFIQRLRLLSRWIRYFRYAGPLLRLLLKLQDQFWVFGKTWQQMWAAQSEKAKRLASRSMFFRDIQRLESLTKLQTRLASLPSQYFAFSSLRNNDERKSSSTATSSHQTPASPSLPFRRRQVERLFMTAIETTSMTDASSSSLSVRDIATNYNSDSLGSIMAMRTNISTDDQDDEDDSPQNTPTADATPAASTSTPTATTTTRGFASALISSPFRPKPSSASNTPPTANSTNDDSDHNSRAQTREAVAVLIAQKKVESQRLKRQLDHLKRNVSQSSRITNELYDHLVALTQEVTRTVHSAVWSQNLISPQTRFSVVWRLCVTIALLSELGRLLVSWQVSGTFELRYRDLTKRLLGLCQTKSRPFRKFLGKMVRLPHNHPWLDTCRQSSPSSQLSLTVAWWTEIAIDLIGFLDIMVWFYTGELDGATGVVVPKPFFARCILPGTLTQVLDHPTVPQTIPNILSYFLKASRAVGYSRVIRWGLALYPALDLLLLSPVYHYLFHPMDKDEYLNYTESLVHLSYGLTSNHSLLLKQSSTSHNLMLGEHNELTNHYHGHNPGSYDDEDSVSATEENKEDDFGHFTTFLRPTFTDSYREVLHASISENNGYGLYY